MAGAADAERALAEALPLARQLRNDALVAEILNHQGDALSYTVATSRARGRNTHRRRPWR